MSTLHEAARRVVAAWVSTHPAWIEQCNEAVLALDAALKAQPEPAQEPADPTEYDRRNPLGGPAARFEGIAARLRAGEPYDEVLRDFGIKHIEDDPPRQAPAEREAVLALDAALKAEPAQEPVAWATEIIDALQAQYDTEMIKENDSGDALIRLDDAIAAVEDAEKHYTASQPQRPTEPAQEPAAWAHPTQGFVRWRTETIQPEVVASYERAGWTPLSLYTAPQPQRPPLTDDERRALWRASDFRGSGGQIDWFIEGTRAAERAHGIGEPVVRGQE